MTCRKAHYPYLPDCEYFWLLILQIISDLLHFKGSHKHEFDSRWKSFNLVKKSMENRVRKKKSFYTLLSSVLFLSSEGGKYITSDTWLNTGFTVSVQCIMLDNAFAASRQKAAHQSSPNRQSHAPARGELILKRQVFCMSFYYHFSLKSSFISCESWQWKDVSTGAFTKSWWEIC